MSRKLHLPVLIASAILLLVLVTAAAQNAANATVKTTESPEYGVHLTDAEGMNLYLFVRDEEGASTCTGRCAENWPPLLAEGEPVAGEGVDAELLGTTEREDGGTQVTYAGHPLYRYVRDQAPGDDNGQGLGNSFFLVSAEGEAIKEAMAVEKEPLAEELRAELMAEGQQAYASNCAVCHGEEGQGKIGPRLASNSNVGRTQFLVQRIIQGFPEHGMPPFGHLSDRQIAAISTYVRQSWDNDYVGIQPEEVANLR